jgi:hypothetical protein
MLIAFVISAVCAAFSARCILFIFIIIIIIVLLKVMKVCDLYSSSNIIRVIKARKMRWAGHVVRVAERRGGCKVSVGKPEGKRPLGILRRRWEDNIKMDLQEVGIWGHGLDRAGSDRDKWRALVNAVMNLRGSIKCGEFLDQLRTC